MKLTAGLKAKPTLTAEQQALICELSTTFLVRHVFALFFNAVRYIMNIGDTSSQIFLVLLQIQILNIGGVM